MLQVLLLLVWDHFPLYILTCHRLQQLWQELIKYRDLANEGATCHRAAPKHAVRFVSAFCACIANHTRLTFHRHPIFFMFKHLGCLALLWQCRNVVVIHGSRFFVLLEKSGVSGCLFTAHTCQKIVFTNTQRAKYETMMR